MQRLEANLSKIGILSVGSSCGEFLQTNYDLSECVKNFDQNRAGMDLNQWIQEKYGITSRAITNRLPSQLAEEAVRLAVSKCNLDITEIDFLILNTVTGDYRQPNTATEVQALTGMRDSSFAFELNMPCAGIVYGLALAKSMIMSGMGKFGLVVGVDKMSTLTDPDDFIMRGMFGDGAGACIVGPDPLYTISDSFLASEADVERSLLLEAGGSVLPVNEKAIYEKRHYLRMQGKQTSSFIKRVIQQTISTLCMNNSLNISEIDHIIPHQASKQIILEVLKSMGYSEDQVAFTVEKYGNTSAASLLITLDDYLSKEDEMANLMIMVGMGGGLNWGGILLRKSIVN